MAQMDNMNKQAMAFGLLSAGAGMMDPRGTYGEFGAGVNRGVKQGLATYLPYQRNAWQQHQWQQQQAAREQTERQRAAAMSQMQGLLSQGAPQRQVLTSAMNVPGLQNTALQGLLSLNQPRPPEALEKVMVNGQPQLMPRSQAAGMTPYTPAGMALSVGPEGTVNFSQGNMPAAVQKTLVQDQFNAFDHMARVKQIERSYKPEYLQMPTQLSMKWNSWKDKSGMAQLTQAEKDDLSRYSQFRSGVAEDLNLYIKSITGAQMTNAEADRLKQGIANEDDGPTEFEAKMSRTISGLKDSVIRRQYALKHGVDWKAIPLYTVPAIVDNRGKELEAQIRQQAPNLPQVEVEARVREALSAEFGL